MDRTAFLSVQLSPEIRNHVSDGLPALLAAIDVELGRLASSTRQGRWSISSTTRKWRRCSSEVEVGLRGDAQSVVA